MFLFICSRACACTCTSAPTKGAQASVLHTSAPALVHGVLVGGNMKAEYSHQRKSSHKLTQTNSNGSSMIQQTSAGRCRGSPKEHGPRADLKVIPKAYAGRIPRLSKERGPPDVGRGRAYSHAPSRRVRGRASRHQGARAGAIRARFAAGCPRDARP